MYAVIIINYTCFRLVEFIIFYAAFIDQPYIYSQYKLNALRSPQMEASSTLSFS